MTHNDDYLLKDLDLEASLTQEQIEDLFRFFGANRTRFMSGNVMSDHCWLHGNTSETLGMRVDGGHSWNCFACGAKGLNVEGLVSKTLRISKQQAHQFLVQRYSLSEVKRNLFAPTVSAADTPRYEMPENFLAAYKNSRLYACIDYHKYCTHAQADELGLGYDRINERLMFPVRYPDGVLAGLVSRSMRPNCPKRERWLNHPADRFPRSKVVLGSERPVVQGEPLIIVEGPTDYLRMYALGFTNVRAVFGADFSNAQVEYLVSLGHPVVPFFDLDEAGIDGLKRFCRVVGSRLQIIFCRYPKALLGKGKSDPGDMRPEHVAEFRASWTTKAPIFRFT